MTTTIKLIEIDMFSPELLAPAGDLDRMRTAFDYGADAIYAGQPRYSLRARNNDFSMDNIAIGINEAHARGKKFFVASNISPHNAKVKTYMADMAPIIAMQPDALIMSDPGLILMVREKWPEMPIHLSVQANTVNFATVKFWQAMGLKRVILSRELSLDEIEEIRQLCPEMELEVFVHGALCIAYSGRCLLSGYFNHRDPNQGTCTNSCRWDYKVHDATEDAAGVIRLNEFDFKEEMAKSSLSACGSLPRHPLADNVYLIEEKGRPGDELVRVVDIGKGEADKTDALVGVRVRAHAAHDGVKGGGVRNGIVTMFVIHFIKYLDGSDVSGARRPRMHDACLVDHAPLLKIGVKAAEVLAERGIIAGGGSPA